MKYRDGMTTLEWRDLMDEIDRLEQAYGSAGATTLKDPDGPVGSGWVSKEGNP